MASTSTRTSTDVAKFLDALPSSRMDDVTRVRDVIRKNLPKGYEEVVVKKMLVYQVPLSRYPDTYNGHPLWYIALASRKASLSLHLMSIYFDPAQAARLRASAKKLDIGKACIRFKNADDLPLDAIAKIIAATPVDRWVAIAEAARRRWMRKQYYFRQSERGLLAWDVDRRDSIEAVQFDRDPEPDYIGRSPDDLPY